MVTNRTCTGARFADSMKVFVKPALSGAVIRWVADLYFSLFSMNSHNMSSKTNCVS